MTLSGLPDDLITESEAARLSKSDGIDASYPVVWVETEEGYEGVAVIYLDTGAKKTLLGYSAFEGEWAVIEQVEEEAEESTPDTFDATFDVAYDWLTLNLGFQMEEYGPFESDERGFPFET